MSTHDPDCQGFPTIGCRACIDQAHAKVAVDSEGLSYGARLTLRNRALLDKGIHPATRCATKPELGTCAGCVHHQALGYHGKTWHKCEHHTLGMSHSEASDIRVSWPACTRFQSPEEQA
jgi:hypothetical protein